MKMDGQLGYLEAQITDSCNLNCKGCSHCAGLIEKNKHIPLEIFERDMERLKQLIPNIAKIRILGGEPFLNPRLEEYCMVTRKLYPDADIRITTNGTLCLGKNADFYQILKEQNIGIDLSVYPPTARILDDLKRLFENCGIRYECTEEIRQFAKRITLKGDSEIESTFWNCNSKWCNFLRAGVLSLCPAPVILDWLSERYNLAIDTESGKLDLHNPNLNTESVMKFLNSPNPVCRYCTKLEFFEWQSNSKPKLEDWIVEETT